MSRTKSMMLATVSLAISAVAPSAAMGSTAQAYLIKPGASLGLGDQADINNLELNIPPSLPLPGQEPPEFTSYAAELLQITDANAGGGFIDAGNYFGTIPNTSCGLRLVPTTFWLDRRPNGGGLHCHTNNARTPTDPQRALIYRYAPDSWDVAIGAFAGQSTSSIPTATAFQSGLNITAPDQDVRACEASTSLSYYTFQNTLRPYWATSAGPAKVVQSQPPFGYLVYNPDNATSRAYPNWFRSYDPASEANCFPPLPSGAGTSDVAGPLASGVVSTPSASTAPTTSTAPASTTTTSTAPVSTTTTTTTPVTDSQLKKSALTFAAGAGDASPTLIQHTFVPSQAQANQIVSGDVVPGDEPVYLIAMRGSFTVSNAPLLPLPPGVTSPDLTGNTTYSVATLVIDAKTGQITDSGFSNSYPDLSQAGSPVVTAQP